MSENEPEGARARPRIAIRLRRTEPDSMSSAHSVVILAGGQGSRLKPYTTVLPKPLIPVCDVPILEIVIQQLRDQGFHRLHLAVNRHEALVRSYFDDGRALGVEIIYSKEDRALGTIGPLRLICDQLSENFLVMNGDLLTDVSFREVLSAHLASRQILTVGTCRRSVRIGDGVMDIDASGRVTGFREKPAITFWISNGIYAMSRKVVEFIPRGRPFGMDELILTLLGKGVEVNTFRHDGEWYDIGSAEDLERANQAFSVHRERFLKVESQKSKGESQKPKVEIC